MPLECMKMRVRPGLGGRLLLMVSSLLLCLALLEVALIAFVPPPIVWLDPQESYVRDPDLIHRLAPNQTSFTHAAPVRTNSYGLREDEFATTPPANFYRILCLGDSLTFGNGVRVEDTYPEQLEKLLNGAASDLLVEVINAGVPAYDTWQEISYLERDGIRFQPKLVMLGFYANDVVPKPVVVPGSVGESGAMTRAGWQGLVPDRVVYLLKRSRALLFLRDRLQKLMHDINPSGLASRKEAMLVDRHDPFLEEGWGQVELSLRRLHHLGMTHGFQPLIVVFPIEDQILGQYGNGGYQARLKTIADRIGLPMLDLMPAFRVAADGFGSLFIEWDGHPNARAYRIAAEEIRRKLDAMAIFSAP